MSMLDNVREAMSRFIPSRWGPPFYRQRSGGVKEEDEVIELTNNSTATNDANARKGKRARTALVRRAHGSEVIWSSEAYLKFPPFPLRYREMGEVAKLEPVTRTAIETLRQEIFRRGLTWEPIFTSKCKRCKREFHGDVPIDRCPNCDPAPKDIYSALEELYRKMSEGDEGSAKMLEDVLKTPADDAEPHYIFVYGQMKEKGLLKSIIGREPELKSASIKGFTVSTLDGLPNLVKGKMKGMDDEEESGGENTENKATGQAFEIVPMEVYKMDRFAYQYRRVKTIATIDGIMVPCYAYSLSPLDTHNLDLMEYPDPLEYKDVDRFFQRANNLGQSLREVLESCEDDINIYDDAYLVVRKEYKLDKEGRIQAAKVVEILRGAPALFRKVVDPFNRSGGLYRQCLSCGHLFSPGMGAHDTSAIDPGQFGNYEMLPRGGNVPCPRCKKHTYDCLYVEQMTEGGEVVHGYIQGEIIHWQKYAPGPTFGYPPILTLWPVIGALMYQNTYIRDYYENRQTPKAVISVVTSNVPSFFRFWSKVAERLKKDRHYIPVVPVEADGTGKGGAQMIKLMDSLVEMEYTAARDEMRQRISSFYGVSPTFMNDTDKDRGIATQDGINTVVTARAVEKAHQIYNNKVLVELVNEIFGIKRWRLKLLPPEYRDQMKEEQTRQLKVQTAQQLFSMGFKVDLDSNGELVYWMPDISDAQLSQITQLITAKVQAKAAMEMGMAQGGNGGSGGEMNGQTPKTGASQPGSKEEPKMNWGGTGKKGTDMAKAETLEDYSGGTGISNSPGGMMGFKVGGLWNKAGQPEVDNRELEKGVLVEAEHVVTLEDPGDLDIATRIAKDHLVEIPDYYTRLLAMEEGAKGDKRMEEVEKSARGRVASDPKQKAQSGSAYTPVLGGNETAPGSKKYTDSETGKVYDSKEALGGAKRSRNSKGGDDMMNQPGNSDELLDMKLQELLLILKMQQRPNDKMVVRMK